VRKGLAVFVALLFTVAAHAVEAKPKHVFVKADCSGPLGSQIVTSLRDSIRASPGYQLATSLEDDGGLNAIITVFIECSESTLPTGERIVSIASIFGTGGCALGSCSITSNESTLQASLCSGKGGEGCGKDIYTVLDEYMTSEGGALFNWESEKRQKALEK
jgi:hypothetical protein